MFQIIIRKLGTGRLMDDDNRLFIENCHASSELFVLGKPSLTRSRTCLSGMANRGSALLFRICFPM